MVKIASISIAVLAAIVPLAAAKNCQNGLTYCGFNLLKRGNYYNQINEALQNSGQSSDYNHINYSLFRCLGGGNGDIQYIKYCRNCEDGGSNKDDRCP